MVTQRSFNESYCPANIFLFKVSNRNIGKRCEICSKLRINTSEQSRWQRSDVFIVNFEHISHLILVLLLLTLNSYTFVRFETLFIRKSKWGTFLANFSWPGPLQEKNLSRKSKFFVDYHSEIWMLFMLSAFRI